jgi:hypothetical protein
MTHKSASHIKLLYRQRLFSYVIDKLFDKFKSTNLVLDFKLNYAISILNLISWLPKEMIYKYLESVIFYLILFLINLKFNLC